MSALNLLVKAPVIPFQKRKEESQIRKAKLEHFVTMNVTVSGVTQAYREKRTASVAIAEDDDVEVLIRSALEFTEAMGTDSLSLLDGAKYAEFRKCLSDIVLDTYDTLLGNVTTRDSNNFMHLLQELINSFVDPTAYADQKRYMDTFKKPYKIGVRELSNRLIIVNKYALYLPGSNGNPIYDDNTMKYAFFNMMLDKWQLSFAGTTSELNDPNYTYQMLTRYMVTQETITNRAASLRPNNMMNNKTAFGRRNGAYAGRRSVGQGQSQRYHPYWQNSSYVPSPRAQGFARGGYQGRGYHRGGSPYPYQSANPNGGRFQPRGGGRNAGSYGSPGRSGGRGYAGYRPAYQPTSGMFFEQQKSP